MRIPRHIGVIPDGNRRWAEKEGLKKEEGYEKGISPGMELYRLCREWGVQELTFYGFTVDNTKRPAAQRRAFTEACVCAVEELAAEGGELLVAGNAASAMFPRQLLPYTVRRTVGKGGLRVNFLVNYSWEWDLGFHGKRSQTPEAPGAGIGPAWKTADISRVDLLIRWGGRRRLSGFLPIQSVYADMYVVEQYWPDFKREQAEAALAWYAVQDVTLGG